MAFDFASTLTDVYGKTIQVLSFLSQSFVFQALKIFLLVYVLVLLADIVMLLYLRGLGTDLKYALYGTARPLLSRDRAIRRWEAMLKRLESGDSAQYKIAVLEADTMANEILAGIGLKGEHLVARLEEVSEAQIEAKPLLLEGHTLRNRIITDPSLVLPFDEAQEALLKYKKFFDEVELF